jgi:hypothetical protein
MRPGLNGVLVKVEERGGTRFLVDGADAADRQVYLDWVAAVQSFEDLERGLIEKPRLAARRRSLAQGAREALTLKRVPAWLGAVRT